MICRVSPVLPFFSQPDCRIDEDLIQCSTYCLGQVEIPQPAQRQRDGQETSAETGATYQWLTYELRKHEK